MEASIEIKESEHPDIRTESYRGFFGGLKSRTVSHGTKKRFTVELTLVPTEEERAIILKYKLDELAVETKPAYTEEELSHKEEEYMEIGSNISKEVYDTIYGNLLREMRAEKTQTLLGDYFDNPHKKYFDVRQDAHTYADKLEKEILPLIKDQIDYYRLEAVRKDKRTIIL